MATSVVSGNLLSELERLTLRLSEIVQRDFKDLNSEQLNWRAAPTKWSILECLLHLNYFNRHYYSTLKARLARAQSTQPTPYFSSNWLGSYYLQKYQLPMDSHLKKLSESPRQYAPSENDHHSELNAQQVLDDFERYQQQLLQFVRDARLVNLQRTKVPAFWWGLIALSLGDMLQLLVYHNERHVVQAQRVLYHDHFPGNVPIDVLIADL